MGIVKNILYNIDPVTKPLVSYQRTIFPYYHTVSGSELPHIKYLYQFKDEKQFEKDLDFMLKHYRVLEPGELVKNVNNHKPIPENSFLLSFDDGLSELYKTIIPILNAKGVPCVVFINNRYIDNKELFYKHKISLIICELRKKIKKSAFSQIAGLLNYKGKELEYLIKIILSVNLKTIAILDKILEVLNIDQAEYLKNKKPYLTFPELAEISSQNHYIGGHTKSHYPISELTLDDQVKEISDSVLYVKENLGTDYELFSFPFSDACASRELFNKLFSMFPNLICMGNAGIKQDISPRIIQRFSLENPKYPAEKTIRTNLVYRLYNRFFASELVKR